MAQFNIQIENLDKLQSAMRNYSGIAAPILGRALEGTRVVFSDVTLMPGVVPERTGFLKKTFGFKSSTTKASWGPTRNYASFVEFGTKPHVIRPRNARVLAWSSGGTKGGYRTAASGRRYYRSGGGGQMVFAMHVNHPGTKPNPFMERIVEKSIPGINRLFGQAGDIITREIARQTA